MSTTDKNGFTSPEVYVVAVVKTITFLIITICAVFGNLLVIVSVFKFERLRIIANSFIVSLAFADLLVGLVVMPFNAAKEITQKWLFGAIMCDIFNANDVFFSTASLLNICCISIDRYIAITDPFHYEQRMTKRFVAIMLCVAWGASALISHVPIHLRWYTTSKYLNSVQNITDVCDFIVSKPYAAISSSISFWIPAIILLFAYVKIYREARRQAKHIQSLSVHAPSTPQSDTGGNLMDGGARMTESRRMKREHKAAKTLGIIMGCFLACWLPFFTWYVVDTMCDVCNTPPVLVAIFFWIGYTNSSLNPFIYACFNREFRSAFKKLLRCNRASCSKDSQEEVALGTYTTCEPSFRHPSSSTAVRSEISDSLTNNNHNRNGKANSGRTAYDSFR